METTATQFEPPQVTSGLMAGIEALWKVLNQAAPDCPITADELQAAAKDAERSRTWLSTLGGDQNAVEALTHLAHDCWGLFPYPLVNQRVPASVALAYVEAVAGLKGSAYLETIFQEEAPPLPLLRIGPVFVVGHFNPEYTFHNVLPKELSIPVWLSLGDYCAIRADLLAQFEVGAEDLVRVRAMVPPPRFQEFLAGKGKSLDSDNPAACVPEFLEWMAGFEHISPADEQAIATLRTRDDTVPIDSLPPDLRLLALRTLMNVRVLKTDNLHIASDIERQLDKSLVSDHQLCAVAMTSAYCFLISDQPSSLRLEDDMHNRAGLIPIVAVVPRQQFQQACTAQAYITPAEDSTSEEELTDEVLVMTLDSHQFIGKQSSKDWAQDAHELVQYIFWLAGATRAADVHLEFFRNEYHVRFTTDGVSADVLHLPRHMHDTLAARVKTLAGISLEENSTADGRFVYSLGSRRIQVRVKLLFDRYRKCRFAIRLLDLSQSVHDISNLGLLPVEMRILSDAYHSPDGLIFLCGATGKGKSTTAHAILRELNRRTRVMYSLEDPPEYEIPGVTQIACTSDPRKVTKTLNTFETEIHHLLRATPDVINVGELRNAATGAAFLEIGLSGHTGITTFHAKSVFAAVQRLISWELSPGDLASTTRLFTCQRLVRRVCACHTLIPISSEQRRYFEAENVAIPEGTTKLPAAVGCKQCNHTGYYGRLAIMEMLKVSDRVAGIIRQMTRKDQESRVTELREAALEEGFRSMLQNALSKVVLGQTTLAEVDRAIERVQRVNRVHLT
jgi:type II secretory ATPase GspE/PulE/Tfp pilus assembly ATPase PilB-like protein